MNPDQSTPNSSYSFRGIRGGRGGGGQFRGYARGRGNRGGGRGYGRGRGGRGGGGGRGGFHQQQPNFEQELQMDQPADFSSAALERNYAQFYSPLFTKNPWGSGGSGSSGSSSKKE
ncbi:hypothetical protein BDB00DRAFT_875335 [Zychaea mexicana]|uniref:uncharacterized protein n=1 Tax=Zychaea mexicana TaxID=64656 RepID=UPI0022FEE069|nr:uncharacterized protein BDB00DRAFT_875335 [Zychaea mexicana]KAI9490437.1 hypothetical protein BDB00DRAFT_875335 [Zychaea mexicana]